MKKQTYITYLENKDGKMIDFQRWSYKKTDTILKKSIEFYKEMNNYNWFKKDRIDKADYFAIYATPDGYTKEKNPIIKIPITELLA